MWLVFAAPARFFCLESDSQVVVASRSHFVMKLLRAAPASFLSAASDLQVANAGADEIRQTASAKAIPSAALPTETHREVVRRPHGSPGPTYTAASVSNASEGSDLPYYSNKGRIERIVAESGVDYTILRPALVVGAGDILVNNIAYFLRRLPLFTMFGPGDYRVQPITLDGFADVAVEAIEGARCGETVPVAGPRDWTFLEMVRAIRAAIRSRAPIVHAPAWLAFVGLRAAGTLLGDVVLTSDEIKGLTREYLYSDAPLRRGDDFRDWLDRAGVADALGRRYASELERHFRS